MSFHSEMVIRDLCRSKIKITPELLNYLSRLQGMISVEAVSITDEYLKTIVKHKRFNILLLGIVDDSLVAMAQAARILALNKEKVLIDNVGVFPEHQGKGYGHHIMLALVSAIQNRWPNVKKISLTSSPRRNTEQFYRALGFEPRIGDRKTVVYEMKL